MMFLTGMHHPHQAWQAPAAFISVNAVAKRKSAFRVRRAEAMHLDGLFEGMCKPEEYEHLIAAGVLRRTYEGASGFMGLAKLRRTA